MNESCIIQQGFEMLCEVQIVSHIGKWEHSRNFNSNATTGGTN